MVIRRHGSPPHKSKGPTPWWKDGEDDEELLTTIHHAEAPARGGVWLHGGALTPTTNC